MGNGKQVLLQGPTLLTGQNLGSQGREFCSLFSPGGGDKVEGGQLEEEELASCDPPIPVWPGAEGTCPVSPAREQPAVVPRALTWSNHDPASLAPVALAAAAAAAAQWDGVQG